MKKNLYSRTASTLAAHKILATVIVAIIAIGGYGIYRSVTVADAAPQYTLAMARLGTLTLTVTGTGQVSASNQTDIQSQVSGTIESINVSVGQHVQAGQLLATIDSANAALTLQNAKISYAKLVEPAKQGDLANAKNAVAKSYSDGFNSAATAFTDLATVMAGMKSLLYDQGGFLSDSYATKLSQTARDKRDQVGVSYDASAAEYLKILAEYNASSQTSPTAAIDALLGDTAGLLKSVAATMSVAQSALNYISTQQPEYYSKDAPTAIANVNSWLNTVNSDLAGVVSAQNSVASNNNSLVTLLNGADRYDIQASQLSVDQAQRTYNNYFIRAPYDGVIGRIPVSIYGQAGNGTVMATIVGTQKIASISLNEVDAAKVQVGQPVDITFDAIEGLNATGTVSVVDQIGTVTQGVVSYGVKIAIDTSDERIKPGMSVNTSIITKRDDNVLLVPSSAVKTQGNVKYVQIFDQSAVASARQASGGSASTTRQFGAFASTSRAFGSSTRQFTGGGNGASARTFTISTQAVPTQAIVTVGDTDDTSTVIESGLARGEFVVTKTVSASSQTTSAPSIFSSLGARGPGGNNARTGGGGAVIRAGN